MSTAIEDNVRARKEAEEAVQLVLDYGKELKLSDSSLRHFFECVHEQLGELIGERAETEPAVEERPDLAAEWSTDSSTVPVMPEGTKHAGECIDEVPEGYLEWLAEQDWINFAPDWSEVADWMRAEGWLSSERRL